MIDRATSSRHAIRELQRALVRRRVNELDLRLRIELVALAVLVSGFLFWQARVGLDSIARAQGPNAVAGVILILWVLLAVSGGTLAGSRHLHHLRRRPPGPAWLSLPIDPGAIAGHLAWESRLHTLWTAFPAPSILAAAVGLVPLWWLPVLAAVFALMIVGAGRLGCALAYRAALRAATTSRAAKPITRVLADMARPMLKKAAPAARWLRTGKLRALWRKDTLLARRATAARRRMALPVLLAVLSVVAWSLPMHPALARFMALGLALVAAATFGEWLIALGGEDPFAILRGLPVTVAQVWGSRALWAVLASATLVIGQAVAARSLGPVALQFHLVWLGGATLIIALLAVNYGMTLYPDAEVAQRFLILSLGLSGAASLMIPLLGWIVLLAGFIHSARRLPRWSQLEETT